MKKNSILKVFAFVFIIALAFFPVLKPGRAYAASLKLNTDDYGDKVSLNSIYYDEEDGYVDYENIYTMDGSCDIDTYSAPASSMKIFKVKQIDNQTIYVYGLSEGTGTFTVIGEDGTHKTITVQVKKKYIEDKIAMQSNIFPRCYGTTTMKITSWPGATVKAVIGGDTYKYKIPTKGNVSFKLKKVYKIETGITLTITYPRDASSVYSTTKKYKIYNETFIEKAAAKKKTIKVKCYNLHKGDKVVIKYKGKKYTKKVTKNYSNKNKVVKFKVKKTIKPKYKFTVKIYNKYKQPHNKITFKVLNKKGKCDELSNKFYYYEPD